MHVAIVGNGISGITAARWIRKLSDHRVTVISSETDYFFSRTALMYVYMGHMRFEDIKPYEDWFWKKNRIDLINAHVDQVDFEAKNLILNSNTTVTYDKLIIATGSKSNKFGWPGQELNGVRGLYSLQDMEEMEKYSDGLQRAVIVGGGLIGIEMAEMFRSRHIPVTLLVREKNYWDNVLPLEESQIVTRHIREHNLDLRLESNLQEIIDNGNGKACAIIIKETGERVDCGFVGLTPGVSPNADLVKETALEVQRGIVVNGYLETNIEDVYAIGDCSQHNDPCPGHTPIEAIWYVGRIMGETVAHTVCGNRTLYDPGFWFNSAKFLDIEYMVYGEVPRELPEHMESLYWEHTHGKKSVRINYDKESKAVLGFNVMGIRYRHEVCDKWLFERANIESVLENLSLANFDPEFYKTYEQSVIDLYNRKNNTNLKSRSKRGLDQALSFLKNKLRA